MRVPELKLFSAIPPLLGLMLATTAWAAGEPPAATIADQTKPGAGIEMAEATAGKSALVTSAVSFIAGEVQKIQDPTLKAATADALSNRDTCIQHRRRVDAAAKQAILTKLKDAGLVDLADDAKFPGGLMAGVFPPVEAEGGDCPRLPESYMAAPGSAFGGHHSYPGGLPVHVALNLSSALSLADNYRRVYGAPGSDGLPRVSVAVPSAPDVAINQDIVIAAPVWHDWAKPIVFQWNADGSEFQELNFGGNGKTDAWGGAGDSRTGAHHILGIAEVMKRGLAPDYVITQASAHAAPTGTGFWQVVNWLRAAAILADIDPVAKGYLALQNDRLVLPLVRQLGTANIAAALPNQPNLLIEYVLHNLSDADYTFTGPAVAQTQFLLQALAPRFGYDPAKITEYNTRYRNPVLSNMSAERLLMVFSGTGVDGVAAELTKLKAAGLI
ncbi:MAG TPA: hypothetical protein VNT30_00580 [Stellaceae bacterium]|nr:hypothetical protein [Stellaceae bacterium]